MKGKNLFWFESHITGRKQYINFEINDNNGKTEPLETIEIRSILGSLLFIIYINNLRQVSDTLKLIVFPDNTNLICVSNNIKTIFLNANLELTKTFQDKTTVTFFHRIQERDNLPLCLPVLKTNGYVKKKSSSIKFLGVLVDKQLNWTDLITVLENKLSKNLGLLYKSIQFSEY